MKDRTPVFVSSIEGVISETVNNSPDRRSYYESMDFVFAISQCIAESVKRTWHMSVPLLPLGVAELHVPPKSPKCVQNIIWVGNIKANKRPQWLVEMAQAFPMLSFTMVGDGDMQNDIDERIQKRGIHNITRTGRIPNDKVYEYMCQSDLLLMTSEFEGLPKVIQEAAQCGLPAIYINQNYTVDFIENGVNGFGVGSLDEMKSKLQLLMDEPARYREMAKAAQEAIKPYLWPVLIKDYERYFEGLYGKRTAIW